MVEGSAFATPDFWSWLTLLFICLLLYWRQGALRGKVDTLLQWRKEAETARAELLGAATQEHLSCQTDIDLHYWCELTRMRQSLLELAYDLDQLSALNLITTMASLDGATGTRILERFFHDCANAPSEARSRTCVSNHVFERHTQLPLEFPSETKEQHARGAWQCPNCRTVMPDDWNQWCTKCRRRSFPFSDQISAESANDKSPETLRVSVPPANASSTLTPDFVCEACGTPVFYQRDPGPCPECGAPRPRTPCP